MNYSELTTAIQDYTENTFTSTQLATFVEQAEQRIFNSIQFPSLRKNVTGTATLNNKYLACPTDFLSVYSMSLDTGSGSFEFLLDKDVNFIRQAYPNPSSTGVPKYYALFGPQFGDEKELSFILGPTPDASYSVELHYFYYPESITTAASGQSWLGDNFDPVLLYGSLVEAYTFMKGEADMLNLYNGKLSEALQMAKRLGDGLEKQDAYRSGQPKVPVN